MYTSSCVRSVVSDSATPWTNSPGSPARGIFRQEDWRGLPSPSEDLYDPVIEPASPSSSALQADSLSAETAENPPRYTANGAYITYKPERDSQTSRSKLPFAPLFSRQVVSTLLDPTDCSTPGFPAPQHALQFAQVHVHCIGDAIQPSPPPSPLSLPAFNLSQHQGLFQQVSSSHRVAKVLELQHQGRFPLILTGLSFLMLEAEIN